MNEVGLINIKQEAAQYKLKEPRDMRIVGEKPRILFTINYKLQLN
jgi:hypothetical protein